MLYENNPRFPSQRNDDSALDLSQLADDIEALVEAGLVVRLLGRDGEVRVTPAVALARDIEAPAS
ncbi:hypothetical protein [Conexibacter sp. CPCC 206217]|uniref:hypothetical protein n=1 Tax=Conexibacter sp. CPCC 206217 TaxID=3064574 RepID=UPI002720A0DF|nr:hypothetical protein [Conexibacter sp. CPCC 206217]MDO8210835.1 hypothetical protein [Conexibacter sp. CPCC 206217]